jgi:hypothetical protein
MSEECEKIHDLAQNLERHGFPFDESKIPSNGIYILINENKDRSIFRKNIGRALLTRNDDPFIEFWELDLTTRKAKEKYSSFIDFTYQKDVESQVTEYIQSKFSFCAFKVNNKEERLEVESKIISTVSWCEACKPTKDWLGKYSPKEKIAESGLWLVNELYKIPYYAPGVEQLSKLMKG